MSWAEKGRRLPGNWAALRQATFERDDFTCCMCGHRDRTAFTLECDHVGLSDDHRLANLRTLCGRRSPNNCHGRRTTEQAAVARARRAASSRRVHPPHPGLRRGTGGPPRTLKRRPVSLACEILRPGLLQILGAPQ